MACRIDILDRGFRQGDSAYDALAVEVDSDRALIRLCSEHDIEAVVASFAQPQAERSRLEYELTRFGVDLVALSRKMRTDHS